VTLSLADIALDYNQSAVNVEGLLHKLEHCVAWLPSEAARHRPRGVTSLVGRIMLALQPHFPDCILAAPGPAGTASAAIHIRDKDGRALISMALSPEWDDDGHATLNEIYYHQPTRQGMPNMMAKIRSGDCRPLDAPETIRELAAELKRRIGDRAREDA
jgi:hypothetical protein